MHAAQTTVVSRTADKFISGNTQFPVEILHMNAFSLWAAVLPPLGLCGTGEATGRLKREATGGEGGAGGTWTGVQRASVRNCHAEPL